jgi:Tol biopolymer transport system component/DNA-binding winged helix-turn-helix (wHTH) protein
MQPPINQLYKFGPFCLDVSERVLICDGRVVPLSPKLFDTLLVLIENRGRILGKDELMQAIWPDAYVEESNLTHNISQIRRALGDGEYIETIPRRGYRFVSEVQTVRREAQGAETVETGDSWGKPVFISPNGSISAHSVNAVSGGAQSEMGDPVASVSPSAGEIQPDMIEKAPALNLRRAPWLAALVLVGLAIVLLALFVISRPVNDHAEKLFRPINPTKITTSGNALHAAVSRDGRYVAYVMQEGDRQSLWIRQAAATSQAQIVAPADVAFSGVTFAPDDNFIYYVARAKGEPVGQLYQIPVLGGAPKHVMSGVDSPVTFSPDGQSLAFVRDCPASGERSLITVRLNGSDERKLLTRKRPQALSLEGPSWSPDGTVIACGAYSMARFESPAQVLAVSVIDGSARQIGNQAWTVIGQVAWLGDGSGVVFVAWRLATASYGDPLWLLTYPKGEARQLTGNMTTYASVSVSADSGSLVMNRRDRVSRLWVVPASGTGFDVSRATQLQYGFGDSFSDKFGLDWTPDGRLIYASQASGNLDIWVNATNNQQPRQLTREALADMDPTVSADGRYIVFMSTRSGHGNIWRMNIDGSNPIQLTQARGDSFPSLSPDGRWVIYSSWNGGQQTLWKTSIDGGEPVQLTQKWTSRPIVSPDGKWIACFYQDEKGNGNRVALLPFAGGELRVIEEMAYPEFLLVRWSPDSHALTYIVTHDGVSNIWSQSIDGSQPRQLTRFTTDRIFRYAWSRDGKRLACERGQDINDIVLIGAGKSGYDAILREKTD